MFIYISWCTENSLFFFVANKADEAERESIKLMTMSSEGAYKDYYWCSTRGCWSWAELTQKDAFFQLLSLKQTPCPLPSPSTSPVLTIYSCDIIPVQESNHYLIIISN